MIKATGKNNGLIFISIPAYEDPLLLQTIKSCLDNAENPNRLRFVIALQYKKNSLPDISSFMNDARFTFLTYDVDSRPGVIQIRKKILEYFKNEEYYLMIDSHMLFEKKWDTILIKDLREISENKKHKKVIISKTLSSHLGKKDDDDYFGNPEICKWSLSLSFSKNKEWLDSFDLRASTQEYYGKNKYELTNFISCHFMFTTGNWVKDVGIILPFEAFHEQEFLSFHSFLKGWDIYSFPFYNHLVHLHAPYNLNVYGQEFSEKLFSSKEESLLEEMAALKNVYIYNDFSKLKILNTKRTPEDFFKSINLEESYNLARKVKILSLK
jgi:hypothetical protein